MILVREVYAWLRYRLSRDPLAKGLVVEEISSSDMGYSDSTDGCRTLAIYDPRKGLDKRIELRFTSLHPQVHVFHGLETNDGTYHQMTNPYGFPGDSESWDVSDTVDYLIGLTHKTFCPQAAMVVIQAAPSHLDLPTVKRIIDSAKRAGKSGKRLDRKLVNQFLKEAGHGDVEAFGWSVIKLFREGKLKWDDLDHLEDEYPPGKDIIPWPWMARRLSEDKVAFDKLPTPVADRVVEEVKKESKGSFGPGYKAKLDAILAEVAEGKKVELSPLESPVLWAERLLRAVTSGAIPSNYFEAFATADLSEDIAPWSFLGRRLLVHAAVENKGQKAPLEERVVGWVSSLGLILPFYRGQKGEEEILKGALAARVKGHTSKTLKNPAWMKALTEDLAGTKEMDRARAIQAEFDLWLMDAISPSTPKEKIPVSAYAFSPLPKDQQAYGALQASWTQEVRAFLKDYRQESLATLTSSLKGLYAEVLSVWAHKGLRNYKPKVPSVGQLIEAALAGNEGQVLKVFVRDLEDEIGSDIPEEVSAKLKDSPWLRSVLREVRIQSVKL